LVPFGVSINDKAIIYGILWIQSRFDPSLIGDKYKRSWFDSKLLLALMLCAMSSGGKPWKFSNTESPKKKTAEVSPIMLFLCNKVHGVYSRTQTHSSRVCYMHIAYLTQGPSNVALTWFWALNKVGSYLISS